MRGREIRLTILLAAPTVWREVQSPSRPIIEIKQRWTRLALGSVTAFFAVKISCDRLGVDCFLTNRAGGVDKYSFGV